MVNLTAFLRAAQNLNQATKILQRTFEVKTVKKTRSLVKKWTKYEVPIAVDIESHNNGKPGLITIKDRSGNVYFIRTGLDHNLTTELKDVFENSKVIKIMHGAGTIFIAFVNPELKSKKFSTQVLNMEMVQLG